MNEISKEYPKKSGPVPNIINDEWSKRLKGNEFKIVFLIARKTFGFWKEWDKIAISQMAKYTGLSERTCQRLRKELINRGVILCKSTSGGNPSECCEYSINMGWHPVTRDNVSPVTNDVSRGDKMTPEGVTAATPTKFTLQNSQSQNSEYVRADDNPLNRPKLKTNASSLCVEAMAAFSRTIKKREPETPNPILWALWCKLAGSEQAVYEIIMGIVLSQSLPDKPIPAMNLSKLFSEPERLDYWRQFYKPVSGWWTGKTDHEIITRLVSLLKIGNDIDPAIAHLIPLAKERAAQPMERIAV